MSSSERSTDSLTRLLEQIPASVTDEDLDGYIANLILQQSKQRNGQYERKGISAYQDDQPGPSNRTKAASTNKAFLASVIRNVEGHNSALLRQQIADTQRAARDQRRRKLSHTPSTSSAVRSSRQRSLEPEHEHRQKPVSAEDYGYSSKMDKYFSKDYDPALDIGVDDLTDGNTGLIATEGETSSAAWDRMLNAMTPQTAAQAEKEAKARRKEERDRIRSLRKDRRESRDRRHKRDRSRSPSPRRHRREDESRHSSRSRHKDEKEQRHRHASKSAEKPVPPTPKAREWDLGKNLSS